jgi:hypothetical protein
MKWDKTFEATEQDVADNLQDAKDLGTLRENVAKVLAHDGAMMVPVAVRRLIDLGVDPVVVAKYLLIGDRDGGVMYRISSRSVALAQDEGHARGVLSVAIRELDADLAATVMVSGAVWLAEQFALDRDLLASLVAAADRRAAPVVDRHGYGVVDLVDLNGVGSRQDIVTAVRLAQLPLFAPLEFRPRGAT